MKESKRKKDVRFMSEAIDDTAPFRPETKYVSGSVSPKVISSSKADEIIATKKLEIPKCDSRPVNGRIYVVSILGGDMKTPGGLLLPPRFNMKKSDDVENVKRYFVVTWDTSGDIPQGVLDKLHVGIEVNPFLPQSAEELVYPRVVDWNTGNIFEVIHWSELAGISRTIPTEVE